MSKRIDRKILLAEIKRRIREFYPYFLGFYFLSLMVAVFSKMWRGFFYWPAFHILIIFFSMLFVLTFAFDDGFRVSDIAKYLIRQVIARSRQHFIFVRSGLMRLSRRTWLKLLLIAAIMIVALLKSVGIINLFVLLYALISFLFVCDSRAAASIALLLLASCPMLLLMKKDLWAENTAVYAYYFLVITVLTQIRELRRDDIAVDNSIDSVVVDRKR
jgi:hypothetical protein